MCSSVQDLWDQKEKTEADKCQGYFFNKEIMGFSVSNCSIKYKYTVLENRDPCQFL